MFSEVAVRAHWWLLIAICNGGGGTFPDLPEEAEIHMY